MNSRIPRFQHESIWTTVTILALYGMAVVFAVGALFMFIGALLSPHPWN